MGKNQDPGPGINIPDPPHCNVYLNFSDEEEVSEIKEIQLEGKTVKPPQTADLIGT
jgi:hypothetical protein